MPDLTFSEIELERNVLGKSASSETWLDGVVVSSAEATRKRIPNVQTTQADTTHIMSHLASSHSLDPSLARARPTPKHCC